MRFPYHTEPIRPALITLIVLIIAGVLLPDLLLRVLLFSSAGGVALWIAFQRIRQNRGISVEPDALVIQDAHRGTVQRIDYATVQGCTLTKQEGFAVAYRPALKSAPASTVPSLADARPEPTFARLIVTPAIDNGLLLLNELGSRVTLPLPLDSTLVLRMASHRRTRRRIIWFFLILAIPLYMYIITRALAMFKTS